MTKSLVCFSIILVSISGQSQAALHNVPQDQPVSERAESPVGSNYDTTKKADDTLQWYIAAIESVANNKDQFKPVLGKYFSSRQDSEKPSGQRDREAILVDAELRKLLPSKLPSEDSDYYSYRGIDFRYKGHAKALEEVRRKEAVIKALEAVREKMQQDKRSIEEVALGQSGNSNTAHNLQRIREKLALLDQDLETIKSSTSGPEAELNAEVEKEIRERRAIQTFNPLTLPIPDSSLGR